MVLSTHNHQALTRCMAECGRVLARTQHFIVYAQTPDQATPVESEDVIVVHHFKPAAINNDIGYYVVNELLPALAELRQAQQLVHGDQIYRLNEQQIFERYVGDIVRSMDGNEARAWHKFYDNTLNQLVNTAGQHQSSTRSTQSMLPADQSPHAAIGQSEANKDFIDNFAAIYQCAAGLLDIGHAGESLSLLDVATCFGFFPLFVHRQQNPDESQPGLHVSKSSYQDIAGCDHNLALVDLANSYVERRKLQTVSFIFADILAPGKHSALASQPRFDVVTAIHLLEHLQPQQTELAIANLWRLTRRRLIISVPLEEQPDPQFGHLQVFDPARLRSLAESFNTSYQVFEHHGGWIILDRLPGKARSPGSTKRTTTKTTSTTKSTNKRSDHHAEVSY